MDLIINEKYENSLADFYRDFKEVPNRSALHRRVGVLALEIIKANPGVPRDEVIASFKNAYKKVKANVEADLRASQETPCTPLVKKGICIPRSLAGICGGLALAGIAGALFLRNKAQAK